MTRKFFLDQHGCAKNQVDGELLIARLCALGMERVTDAAEADLIIVNSCGFIESAKTESLNAVMDARAAYPTAKVLLAGCLAERYADVFRTELPEADGIFGNGDLAQVDGTVAALFAGERPLVTPPQQGVCCGDRDLLLSFAGSAYVKITEGCDNRCTFCAIPLIRGRLRSRNAADIVAEVRHLVAGGTREINLIGQDLAAYGCGAGDAVLGDGRNGHAALYGSGGQGTEGDLCTSSSASGDGGAVCASGSASGDSAAVCTSGSASGDSAAAAPQPAARQSYLARLLEQLSAIPGEFWVRLLYIHPDHFPLDILPLMQRDRRIVPYFDIPFQSGSDAVIRAMNRRGTADRYVRLVQDIRAALPDACIRTTFLTGFPGETAEQAAQTQAFLGRIQSDWGGCFAYSREEGTPAARLTARVSKKEAERRAQALRQMQAAITEERLKNRCNQVYQVLVEEIIAPPEDGEPDAGLAIGRAWFQAPEVDGSVVIRYDADDERAVAAMVPGAVVPVRCFAASAVDVDGELVLEPVADGRR